jgi:hypothetical protein
MIKAATKNQLKLRYHRVKHQLPLALFIGGFILDALTLGRIDDPFNLLLLSFYLLISAWCLIPDILHEYTPAPLRTSHPQFLRFREEALHFCLGSLLSAFTLFYLKSSSLAASFFFMLLMALLMIANELPGLRSLGPVPRVALMTLCLISYLLVFIPTLFGSIGIATTLIALAMTSGLIVLTARWATSFSDKETAKKELLFPGFGILGLFVLLSIFKLIPPVPLALESVAIYHKIERTPEGPVASTLTPAWKFWRQGDQIFEGREGDEVFVYAAVFAPKGFSGHIVLHWQIDQDGSWKTSDRIALDIHGGRDGGFRGFGKKAKWLPGHWRILVESSNGAEIGRIKFEIRADSNSDQREFRKLVLD